MELNWQLINNHPSETIHNFAQQINSSQAMARVLLNRGVKEVDLARRFLKPALAYLHDPFLMAGMKEAVERIQQAIDGNERILIYGDYDVDGTTATAMLLRFFLQLNCKADFYVPDRLLEGYGVSEPGIRHAHQQGYHLIITVDCGITAVEEIALARQLGIDVIICDHHQPGPQLPVAAAILNPKRAGCNYPFKELAGVGVAFKLVQALQSRSQLDDTILLKSLEFAAIGSSADIVPLVDENRIFVKFGLGRLRMSENLGVRALLAVSGIENEEIGTGQVVFAIAPRINAVGRLGDAGRAIRLLTCDDQQQAKNIAAILESENRIRRNIDDETFLQAIEVVETRFDPKNQRILVLDKEGWHPGVIGIVASRIAEKYYRPTVMIATDNGKGRGSARSIPGFDMYQALSRCRHCMLAFGGHKYAAGLSLEADKIPAFRESMTAVADEMLNPELLVPKLWIDSELRFKDIDATFLKLLRLLGPFGPQNMRPVFLSTDLQVVGTPTVVGKNHLKFKVRQDDKVMHGIGFNLGDLSYRVNPGEKGVQMVYSIEENEWEGRKTLQLRVKDLR
jgi:single-stranded-DNA-specific exonuclease